MSTVFSPMPIILKSQFKITRTRSTQWNFTVIVSNFWACSCRPIHKRLLLCSVLQVYMCETKNKIRQNKKRDKNRKKTLENVFFTSIRLIQCSNRRLTAQPPSSVAKWSSHSFHFISFLYCQQMSKRIRRYI